MELLEGIKILLEIEDNSRDEVLKIMIEDSKRAILDYCLINTYKKEFDSAVRELVVNAFKSSENEGVASITRGNTSISYITIDSSSFSEKIKAMLHRYKKIKVG